MFLWMGVFVSFSHIEGHVVGYYNCYRKALKMKRAIWTAVIIFSALLTIAIATALNNKPAPIIVTSVPYTSTPPPRPTPTPQPPSLDLPGCDLWYELLDNPVGDDVCVVGYVKAMISDDSKGDVVRIYLKPDLPRGFRRRVGAPKDFYFFDDSFSYADLKIDDCITASGTLSINNDGVLFMRLDGNLLKCP